MLLEPVVVHSLKRFSETACSDIEIVISMLMVSAACFILAAQILVDLALALMFLLLLLLYYSHSQY
jgi:hypothetical protein